MLKRLVLAASLAAIIGGGAMAQGRPAAMDWKDAPHPAGSVVGPREDDRVWIRHERKMKADLTARRAAADAATDEASDVSATAPYPPPANWTTGVAAWRAHMRLCAQRYQTYDPETDMFYPRPRVQARCGL